MTAPSLLGGPGGPTTVAAAGAGEGRDRARGALPPAADEFAVLAGRVGDARAQRGACHRTTPGLGKRTTETNAVDLQAMVESLLAGRGLPVRSSDTVLTELTAWSAHRTAPAGSRCGRRRRTGCSASWTGPSPAWRSRAARRARDKVGRLVAAGFADPARLAALGTNRFIRFGATRGLQIRKTTADKLVSVARDALPTPDAAVARAVLAADLALLADLDTQIDAATTGLNRPPARPHGLLLDTANPRNPSTPDHHARRRRPPHLQALTGPTGPGVPPIRQPPDEGAPCATTALPATATARLRHHLRRSVGAPSGSMSDTDQWPYRRLRSGQPA
jgi:hypothetical protein